MVIDIWSSPESERLSRALNPQWEKFVELDTCGNTVKMQPGFEDRWLAHLNNYLSTYAASCRMSDHGIVTTLIFATAADYTFFLLAHK